MFITVIGIDGAGKSSLIRLLAMRLSEEMKRPVRLTSEPGGTRLGKSIRKLLLEITNQQERVAHHGDISDPIDFYLDAPVPLAELLLFSSARAQHCVRIRDWLAHNEIVLCDRFSDCTWAYQGASGLDSQVIETVEHVATSGLTPDLTFLLDIPVETAYERLANGRVSLDRFEQSGEEFFRRVRARYLVLAERHPERIITLDATEPMEVIAERAWSHILAHAYSDWKGAV